MSDTQSLPVFHWCPSSCHPGVGAQRERISVGESTCGFFQRNCLGLQQPPPPTQSPLVFPSEVVGSYLPSIGILGWGTWCGSGIPCSGDIPPEFLSMWVWGQPISHLCSSYQSGWMWFLQFCSCQTSIWLNFWCSWVIVVLYFSWNFDAIVHAKRRARSAYAAILTESSQTKYNILISIIF